MGFVELASHWRNAVRATARVLVIASIAISGYLSHAYATPSASSWWVELSHYLPFPIWLALGGGALWLSFRLWWPWRVVAAAGLTLFLTAVMGLVIGHPDTGSLPVRMMTYNAKTYLAMAREGGIEALEAEVAAHHPDILVMQDANELVDAFQADQPVGASIFQGRNVYTQNQYIVATRFPLRGCHIEDMSFRERTHEFVHCIVTAQGVDVDLYTAHFLSPRYGLNAARHERAEGVDDWEQNFADRLTQSRTLAAAVAAHQHPVIVAGDLNASESSPVIRGLLATGLRDAFSSAGRGYGYTIGHALKQLGVSFIRIDHILVSPDIGVADAFPGGKDASEHRPVIADLLLKRDR